MTITTDTSPLIFYGGGIYTEIGVIVAIVFCILQKKNKKIKKQIEFGYDSTGPIMAWFVIIYMWPLVIPMFIHLVRSDKS